MIQDLFTPRGGAFDVASACVKTSLVFERHLEDELLSLSADLAGGTYAHGEYHRFYVRDPKYRMIHKAAVRDRVVHQALYDIWQPLFEKKFFFDSYSSRLEKGTMRAIARLLTFIRKTNRNGRQEAWIFHGDVEDFFGSIDHEILLVKFARPSRIRAISIWLKKLSKVSRACRARACRSAISPPSFSRTYIFTSSITS